MGAARACRDGDWVFPAHRDLGLYLARGGSLQSFFNQLFGNEADTSKGRQVPGSVCLPGGRYVPVSASIGAKILHATGVGMAMNVLRDTGCVLVSFGPGAVEQGDFHTGLGLAVRQEAPVVFLCRSVHQPGPRLARNVPDVEALARGHGAAVSRVDGGDVLAAYVAVRDARLRALDGEGPTVVEAVSPSDDGDGCPGSAGDLLRRFSDHLRGRGLWNADAVAELSRRTTARIERAIDAAASAAAPDPVSIFEDVTATPDPALRAQRASVAESEESGKDPHEGVANGDSEEGR